MTWSVQSLIAYLAGFVTVLILVPLSNRLAHSTGVVAHPRGDRWSSRVVPALGGMAIAGGIVAGVALLPLAAVDRIALLAGVAVMLGIGFLDDFRGSGALLRLGAEAIVGASFAFAVTADLPVQLRVVAVLVATFAIPVAVNATNLVDNADGLAASLSLVTAGTLAATGSIAGLSSRNSSIAVLIAAAALAFLVFNRPPARVFMGDSGSLSLGFALAATSVLIVRDALLIPGTLHVEAAMAVPVAWAFQAGDLVMVVFTRLRRGVSPFSGGVDHTSHRLMAAGVSPLVLVVGLGLLAAIVGATAAGVAAFIGGFALMAVVSIALLALVALFEAAVAWRIPMPVQTPDPKSPSLKAAPTRQRERS
jgi:UDP-GlcNAc:undecaprenyl-phosphate/decaprenyl-phosphate GlcNAc-1-phosphate transferase